MRPATLGLTLIMALVLAAFVAGCGTDNSPEGEIALIKSDITKSLPAKVKDQVKNPQVKSVSCKETSLHKYACTVDLAFEADGKQTSQKIPVTSVCDSDGCNWETKD